MARESAGVADAAQVELHVGGVENVDEGTDEVVLAMFGLP